MCNNCGDLGYTIEINAEGCEYISGCDACRIAALEADPAYADNPELEGPCPWDDDGEAEAEREFIYKAEGWA